MSKSKLTGDDVIAIPMKELGFNTHASGNCNGLICAFVEYVAHNEEDKFSSTLDFICSTSDLISKMNQFIKDFKIIIPLSYSDLLSEQKYEQGNEFKLSKKNLNLFNAVQLFKKIGLYQNFKDYCTSKLKYNLISHQIDIPLEIKDISIIRNVLTQVYLDNVIYNSSEWCNYLENLREVFREIHENCDDTFRLAMRISIWFEHYNSTEEDTQNHAIGLYYNVKLNQWMFADNTLLNIERISCPLTNLSEDCVDFLDEKERKKLKGNSIQNAGIIKYIKIIYKKYIKDNPFIPATIQIFTADKNPKIDIIKEIFNKFKHENKFTSEMTKRLTNDESSLVHMAATSNDVQIMKWFLEEKLDLNKKNRRGITPLHDCAESGASEVMKMLLAAPHPKIEINASTYQLNMTPAMLASMSNQDETLKLLMEAKADLTVSNQEGCKRLSAIYIATSFNSIAAMKILLNPKFKLNVNQTTQDDLKRTSACLAAVQGHAEILELLIVSKADINLKGSDGYAPIHLAAQEGHLKILSILLKHSVKLNEATFRGTAACIASAQNRIEALRLLIEAGANLTVFPPSGCCSPLHVAAIHGVIGPMQILLEEKDKINLDLRVLDGATPTYLAAQENQLEMLRLLTKAGACVNLARENGLSPLHMVAYKGNLEAVQILLDCKADINHRSRQGETALDIAKQNNHWHIVSFFEEITRLRMSKKRKSYDQLPTLQSS